MSFRAWLSIITLFLIAVIIFFSRHELLRAWLLLEHVNIGILLLMIPGQIIVYYAGAEMMFSYLRAKKSIRNVSPFGLARMALEMNFVNHVLPSGGVSGISYMSWRLGKYGVTSGRATMAQAVRFGIGFLSFIALLIIAVVIVTIDGNINRWIILVSSLLAGGMVATIVGAIYVVGNQRRMHRVADWITRVGNRIIERVSFHRKQGVLKKDPIVNFFSEIHHDYVELRGEKRILFIPFLWGLLFNVADVGLFVITFWALGAPVNPAPILIAYGVASVAGFFVVTPGGAGAYEAIMVAFLAVAGISSGTAIAGIVLARVIILVGTIGFGYIFYQLSLVKYGKQHST